MLKQFESFVNEDLNVPDELEGPVSSEFKNYNERLISKPENETYIRGIFSEVAETIGTPLNKIFDIKLENAPKLDKIIKKYDEHLQIKHTDTKDIKTNSDSDESQTRVTFTMVQNEDNDFKGVFITDDGENRRLATDKNGLKFLDELYKHYNKDSDSEEEKDTSSDEEKEDSKDNEEESSDSEKEEEGDKK